MEVHPDKQNIDTLFSSRNYHWAMGSHRNILHMSESQGPRK